MTTQKKDGERKKMISTEDIILIGSIALELSIIILASFLIFLIIKPLYKSIKERKKIIISRNKKTHIFEIEGRTIRPTEEGIIVDTSHGVVFVKLINKE